MCSAARGLRAHPEPKFDVPLSSSHATGTSLFSMALVALGVSSAPLVPVVIGLLCVATVTTQSYRWWRRDPGDGVQVVASKPGALSEQRAWYHRQHQRWGQADQDQRRLMLDAHT